METDTATGLNHTLWRKDDNLSGRWTSPDPYGGSMTTANPQSFNRYAYVSNDPVNHVDPLGLTLADCGIYQTGDPEYAFTLTGKSDSNFKKLLNQQAQENWYQKLSWQEKLAYLTNNRKNEVIKTGNGPELCTTIFLRADRFDVSIESDTKSELRCTSFDLGNGYMFNRQEAIATFVATLKPLKGANIDFASIQFRVSFEGKPDSNTGGSVEEDLGDSGNGYIKFRYHLATRRTCEGSWEDSIDGVSDMGKITYLTAHGEELGASSFSFSIYGTINGLAPMTDISTQYPDPPVYHWRPSKR